MSVLVEQHILRLLYLRDGLHHVNGYADRARLVSNGAGNRLPYPPCGVGRELVALGVVELLDCLYQTDVAFLNQVEERHASADEMLCNADNKPEVCFNKAVTGVLVTSADLFCELYFLLGGKQRDPAYFLEVNLDRVVHRNAVRRKIRVLLAVEVEGVVEVVRRDVVDYLNVVRFEVVVKLVYLLGVDVHFFNGVGYLLGRELTALFSAFEKFADNFCVAHCFSFPVLNGSRVSNMYIIRGSPSASCCGWGGGACGAPWFRSA